MDINKNEIEKEVYEYQNNEGKYSYMNYIFCPTLEELLQKYDYDIKTINYKHIDELDEDQKHFKHYVIDFRDAVKGELIIDYSDPYTPDNDIHAWMSSIRNYPIYQLLKLHVNIPSWNKYGDKFYKEKEIANKLYNILNYKPYISYEKLK
jgi:hypothetical protein